MTGFPINPPNAPLVDERGFVTPEWYRFFRDLQTAVGGPSNPFDDIAGLAAGWAAALGESTPPNQPLTLAPPTVEGVAAAQVIPPVQEVAEKPPQAFFPVLPVEGNLSAGMGLTGGGNTGSNVNVDVGEGLGITVNDDDVQLDTTHPRNVDHSAVSITAGTGLTGGGTIEATRNIALDTTNTRNVDHATITITAGAGLSGGGTIDANITIDLENSGVIAGLYLAPINSISVDQYGRVTSIS